MSSLDRVVQALKTGATQSASGPESIRELYRELKDALANGSRNPSFIQSLLALFEHTPDRYLPDLLEELEKAGAVRDRDVTAKAEQLLSIVTVGNVEAAQDSQVNIAGRDVNNITLYFPPLPPSQAARELGLTDLVGLAFARLNSMLTGKTSEHSEFFQKYILQVYVKREGADEAFARFLQREDEERCCFVVTGKAGKGKTNLFCHLASTLNSRPGLQIPVLLSSSELRLDERDLRTAIVERMFEAEPDRKGLPDLDILKLARLITAGGGSLIVFLDALNELEGTDVFRRFNRQLEQLIRDCRDAGSRVLFCLSCRSEIWPHFKSSPWAQSSILGGTRTLYSGEPTLELGDFNEDDIDRISQRYFQWYAIEAELKGSARRSCCDPLMLRYLCAAYTHRSPNDKSTPPDAIPKRRLGDIRTLRRKEAFDSFVKNRRQGMLKAALRALHSDDERLVYRSTTLYLITMAYRMYERRRVFLNLGEVIEIARELNHPDRLLAEKGEAHFLYDPDSVFFRLVDEGIILNKHDQHNISFTFEAYFEYSLGRYFALERWPRLIRETGSEDAVVEDFSRLLEEHRLLTERFNFHNLFGACNFAMLETEQSSETAWSVGGRAWSPTLFIQLIGRMSRTSQGGFDWIQQACATIRETAIAQPAAWEKLGTLTERAALETRFDELIRILDHLTRVSEWVVLWDLEETLAVLATANFEITLDNVLRWVEKGNGLQPIFGIQALLRLSRMRPELVLGHLLRLAGEERFQQSFWHARTLIAAGRALADLDRGSLLSHEDRERVRQMVKGFAANSPVPMIRGLALAALPFLCNSRHLSEVNEIADREEWPWALWNLAYELQFWKREADLPWLWDLLERLARREHPHVRYAVDCAVESLRQSAPPGRLKEIQRLLRGNRWRKTSLNEMGFTAPQIGIVYSPAYLEPAYDNHVECRERIQVIIDKLERIATGLFVWVHPRTAADHEILRAHKVGEDTVDSDRHRDHSPWPRYLEDVAQAGKARQEHSTSSNLRSGPAELRFESYEAAQLSAGGVLRAVDYALNGTALAAWAINRPPGHLANNTICIFNNVAIAALYARERYGKNRIFILDFDAHHGSHTNRVFRRDPDAIYFSIHQKGNYAAEAGQTRHTGEDRGKGFTFNVNYPPRMGDAGYAYIVDHLLEPVLRDWKPEIIFLSAGFDGHFDDPLTLGNLTEKAYIHLAERIRAIALDLGIKVVATFEGGYGLEGTTNSTLHMLRILGDWPIPPEAIGFAEPPARLASGEDPGCLSRIKKVVRHRVVLMAKHKARNPDYPFDLDQPHWRRLLGRINPD